MLPPCITLEQGLLSTSTLEILMIYYPLPHQELLWTLHNWNEHIAKYKSATVYKNDNS